MNNITSLAEYRDRRDRERRDAELRAGRAQDLAYRREVLVHLRAMLEHAAAADRLLRAADGRR